MTHIIDSPVEALDLHLSYWEWLSHAPDWPFIRFADAYGNLGSVPPLPPVLRGQVIKESIYEHVNEDITTFVAPDIANLTRQWGESMPPDRIYPTDLPRQYPFIVLGEPWPYQDVDYEEPDRAASEPIPIRAIATGLARHLNPEKPDSTGLLTFLFTDHEHYAGQKVYKAPLILIDALAWSYDDQWSEAPEDFDPKDLRPGYVAPHLGLFRRRLLCLLRFMNEQIVATSHPHLPRAAQRRYKATRGEAPEDGTLVSVHLRRMAQKPTHAPLGDEEREAHEVLWSHRFWVSGHWRTNHKTGVKDIWVRPHLKPNDESLPIVIKEKLVSVDR